MTTVRTPSQNTYLDLLHSVSDGWAEAVACHDHRRRQDYEALIATVSPKAAAMRSVPVRGHAGWTCFGSDRGGEMPVVSLVLTMKSVVKCGAQVLTC